jgi:hypothetical protein
MLEQINAVKHIKTMNGGGSKSQLIVGSDDRKYVIKLINNPQKTRILANEYVVGRLAKILGVPIPEVRIINVDQELVNAVNKLANHTFQAGPAFGSLYVGGDRVKVVPSSLDEMRRTSNIGSWPNAIVLDALVQNEDIKPEHVLIEKNLYNGESKFWHIDHGHCLGVDRGWNTLNISNASPRSLLYPEIISGANPFREAFQRLQEITPQVVDGILADIPHEKWDVPASDFDALKGYLEAAKSQVPNAIIAAKGRFVGWSP